MSKYIGKYVEKGNPAKIHIMKVNDDATCQSLLSAVSEKFGKNFITIFLGDTKIKITDKIAPYINDNPDGIFVFSTDSVAPGPDFYEKNKLSKIKTIIIKAEEAGIITNKVKIPKQPTDKDIYNFFFTGGPNNMLLTGIEVELSSKMNPTKCKEKLQQALLDKKIDMDNRQLIIYLPGGLPFINGTLSTIYDNEKIKAKHVIYGVLTRNIYDKILNSPLGEICNINDFEHRLLISPLVDSSDRGLSDMACLLGYLSHKGEKSDLLLRTLSAVIHFPPLITSMKKIIENEDVVGRDVVTFCSTLFTFFRAFLPDDIIDHNVFEYSLQLCNLISHINNPPEELLLDIIDKKGDSDFITNLGLGFFEKNYFWMPDSEIEERSFQWIDFSLNSFESIEKAFELIASFTPIDPFSVRLYTSCTIVKGIDHEYLFIENLPKNKISFIDPMIGKKDDVKDVEEFVKKVNSFEALDDPKYVIDLDKVRQIIMVNLDESLSMLGNLKGYSINSMKKDEDSIQRSMIAYQLLTIFVNKLYAYRIPCIQGLASFNYLYQTRCNLTPLVANFEKGLDDFKPKESTKLWDSIHTSMKSIIKFRKDKEGRDLYLNAISRILVISDGDDTDSSNNVQDVLKELIMNKIIVDSIVISNESVSKMLSVVSHATGGFSYQVETIKDAISLFEQCSFLNIEERLIDEVPLINDDEETVPSKLELDQITSEFMEDAYNSAKFDKEVKCKFVNEAFKKLKVLNPSRSYSVNNPKAKNYREKRIMKEIREASELDDDNIVIFILESNINKWKICIKGENKSPYEKKWWLLYLNLPEFYPDQPPEIRFITVPYHLNVSKDGKICIDSLYFDYDDKMSIVEIILEIKNLFKKPNRDSPLHIDIWNTYLHDRGSYERLARESALKNAKNKYEDLIGNGEDETAV